MMFEALRQRARDMASIAALCRAAEAVARAEGEAAPGAEHFLLAALDLPDDSAARGWAALGQSRETLRAAISGQYVEALASVGVDAGTVDDVDGLPHAPPAGPFRASGSGQALLQAMAADKAPGAPFRTVEVFVAAAALRHGVVPRAFRRLGITPGQLAALGQSAG